MLSVLHKLGSWLLQKIAGAGLIVLLGLLAYGLWLFLKDNVNFAERRAEFLQLLNGQHGRLEAARNEEVQRLAALRAEWAVLQQRSQQAERILGELRELDSWWQRWVGDRAQARMNDERRKRLEVLQRDARARSADLQQQIEKTSLLIEGLEIATGKLAARLEDARRSESQVMHYARMTWDATHWYVIFALAGWFIGPTLGKLIAFYLLAPWIARSRPIRFVESLAAMPESGESGSSIDASIWPGETLRIKGRFLQASDEGFFKRTRFLLDWRIPFTSLACGLIELIEMRHQHAGGELRVTFSSADDPHTELAMVHVPEGASLILRPSFLVGAITRTGESLRIRRRWALGRWQSWVTLQFRYFEFVGPCRLVVAGTRGVRVERLALRGNAVGPARRTNQDATIGFTPNLDYRPVRAEAFWGYYRGTNPLFDDLFAGTGLFLCQESARGSAEKRAGKFWAGVRAGALRVLGL